MGERGVFEQVGENERLPWPTLVGAWLGVGITPALFMAGGALVIGLSMSLVFMAAVLGSLGLLCIMVIQGKIGKDTGYSTHIIATSSLGEVGSRVICAGLITLLTIGWYGIEGGMGGLGFAKLLTLPLQPGIVIYSIAIVAAAAMGIRAVGWISLVSGIATIGFAAYGLSIVANTIGFSQVFSATPPEPFNVLFGISLVMGFAATFTLRINDFTRWNRSSKDIAKCSFVGLAAPSAATIAIGAILSVTAKTWNLADVLEALGMPQLAYSFLAVGFLAVDLGMIYSLGLSVAMLTKLNRRKVTIIVGVIGTIVAASGFWQYFMGWLKFLGIAPPALIGVIISDYYLVRHRSFSSQSKVNPAGVIAFLLGSLASYVSTIAYWGVPFLNAFFTGMVTYYLLSKALSHKTASK